jgi:hypothetical protein
MGSERRRAERHPVDLPGELLLSGGRRVAVRVLNLGALGALCEVTDLEEPIAEGERAVLEHPRMTAEGKAGRGRQSTVGSIVRVQLEFGGEGVSRHLAMFFDGGAPPGDPEAA